MARASIRNMLSLDRYAKIMSINPVHFNGGYEIELVDGRKLFPINNAENNIWPQNAWYNADQISREDLALAIQEAEFEIVQHLKFFPTPSWVEGERYQWEGYYRPDWKFDNTCVTQTGVILNYDKFISGGRRKSELIESRAAVVYSDPDIDGWDELATVTCVLPVAYRTFDKSEIKLYFNGHDGDRSYEIRDFKSKSYDSVTGTIVWTFNSWMMTDPELWEVMPADDNKSGQYIDLSDTASFVTVVDVYREYNDTTQSHVSFYYERYDLQQQSWGGYLMQNSPGRYVIPLPGAYDTVDAQWEFNGPHTYSPDYFDLWYYSGMRNNVNRHPLSDDYLPNEIATAIAYLATARLERVFYANNNATSLAEHLREDLALSKRDGFRRLSNDVIENPFGTRKGEYEAWRRIFKFVRNQSFGGAVV